MWGSEASLANNGIRRSEMWGSWPPSPPTLVQPVNFIILIIVIVIVDMFELPGSCR